MDDEALSARLGLLKHDVEATQQGVAELQQQFETLIEIAINMGTLKPGHAALIEKLRHRVERARRYPVELAADEDNQAIVGEPIDCESRIDLCQARCCSYGVVLSRGDVESGQLSWEIDHPYKLRREADGYCVHLGRDDARCGRYDHRPATCRRYSCKHDARVWLDFEARIPAPLPARLIPLRRLTTGRSER